jgi:hypothetical protein
MPSINDNIITLCAAENDVDGFKKYPATVIPRPIATNFAVSVAVKPAPHTVTDITNIVARYSSILSTKNSRILEGCT